MKKLEIFGNNAQARRWLLFLALAAATVGLHVLLSAASMAGTAEGSVDFRLPPTPTPAATVAAAAWVTPPKPIRNGPVTVSVRLDRQSVLAGGDGSVFAEVVIEGEAAANDHRVPTDLIVVLDHSGSMSGGKIEQARHAAAELVSSLAEDDRFALIGFSSHAEVIIPPATATAARRSQWQRKIRALRAGGGTDMVGGLDVALALLRERGGDDRPCRVLLLSDGHPNTTEGLETQARSASHHGAALSALGIGADFNETLMGRLADLGTGNYYYLDRPEILAAVFAGELDASRGTVARGLEIHLRPAPGITLVDAAGYPLERRPEGVAVRPGDLFAGQTRRLWLRLQVDAGSPFPTRPIGSLELAYQVDGKRLTSRLEQGLQIACVSDRQQFYSGIDPDAWGRAVISEEYGTLQKQVADLVRGGNREEAQKAIEGYLTRQSRRNAKVQNAEVSANLAQVEEMRREVDDAFTGADQSGKQNSLSKKRHELSNQLRRLGSAPENKAGSEGGR